MNDCSTVSAMNIFMFFILAINGREVTARAINRLATWMLEHPELHQENDQISLSEILREPSISLADDLAGHAASERLSSVSHLFTPSCTF